jgi:hypothetical protein
MVFGFVDHVSEVKEKARLIRWLGTMIQRGVLLCSFETGNSCYFHRGLGRAPSRPFVRVRL